MAAGADAALEAQLQLQALNGTILPMIGFSNAGANANNRQTNQFTALTQLITLEMYQYLEFDQVKQLIKRYQTRHPTQNLGVLVNNNLTGLLWHVKDLARRQQPIIPDEVEATHIYDGYSAYKSYVANKEKGENITKLPKYDEKIEFDEWFERVVDVLNMIYGSNMCPLSYVIRLDKPVGWDADMDARNDYERLTYQLQLAGPEFENDNQEVFKLLKNSVNGTDALSYIEAFIIPQDGRGAMMELRRRFEGPNAAESRCTKALSVLESIMYRSERETPFEGMINKLNKAYVVLRKNGGQEFTDLMKVDALAKRFTNVQNNNITLKIAIEQMKTMHRANYPDAVAYMSTKIAEINAANKSITGNPRRVSQGTTGNMTPIRNNNGELITTYAGVDIRNPTRQFTTEEMTQLGFRGRGILAELRRTVQDRQGNARGGAGRAYGGRWQGRGRGRGRGRGGRYGGRGINYGYGRGGFNQPAQNNNANGTNDRQVNATDRTNTNAPESTPSNTSATSANQNGSTQNTTARGNQNGMGYGQH